MQSIFTKNISNNAPKKGCFFQPKLVIGSSHSSLEKQADEVAKKVLQPDTQQNSSIPNNPSPNKSIDRKCAKCEEEEQQHKEREEPKNTELFKKAIAGAPVENFSNNSHTIQAFSGNYTTPSEASSSIETALQRSGSPLPTDTRSLMESKMGYDFSQVKIHNDSQAHASSHDINALAYTHQDHIVFGQNQYQPQTDAGKKLLAHELTHVIQQGKSNLLQAKTIQRTPDAENQNDLEPDVESDVETETDASSNDDMNLIHPAEKKNFARNMRIPFSFVADQKLPSAKKNVRDHPLMIWAISQVFKIDKALAESLVDADTMIWVSDSTHVKDYHKGEIVKFTLTAGMISSALGILAGLGKLPPEASDVFDKVMELQAQLSHRDYSFFMTWIKKENIHLGSITDFTSFNNENFEKIKGYIDRFKKEKYGLLAGYGLLDRYMLTEDVIRDSRFEELKDSLFTKELKEITSEEKSEVLTLFKDKALSTAFLALEEARVIGNEEYKKYNNDASQLQEVAEIITGFSGGFMQSIKDRIDEFISFRKPYFDIVQVDPQTLSTPPSNSSFDKMMKISDLYQQLNGNVPELFKHYRGGKNEIIQLFSAKNCASAMAESLATSLVVYAWQDTELLKQNYYLPEQINNPLFIKFKAVFPKPVRESFDTVHNKCIPIIYNSFPKLATLDKTDEKAQNDMKIQAKAKKHRILQDISIDFRELSMQDIDAVKSRILEILKDKPDKAEKTKLRLSGNSNLVWEFQPLLYFVLEKEGLTKSHPIYTIVSNKIKAVADKSFWESMALAALGLILGIAGLFTGGSTTALGMALLAGSATVSLIDLMNTYEDYSLHSDAYAATMRIPFTTDPSSMGVIFSLAGFILDVGEFFKAIAKATSTASKAAKAGTQAEQSIGALLANSKDIDEYANHLYSFAKKNKMLKRGVSKKAFIKNIKENWENSEKLIESWKLRKEIIDGLPTEVKTIVNSSEFMEMPVEVRESLFKIYDGDPDTFIKLFKGVSDVNHLKPIGLQIFRNPDITKVYTQLSQLVSPDEFERVMRYYATVGIQTADTLPDVLNLMNAGKLFRDADLPAQVLTNRNVQQLLLHFHESPESMMTLWNDYVAKYSRKDPSGFLVYIEKETPYGGYTKLKEASNPAPAVVGSKPYKGTLTDAAGHAPNPKALEGLSEDMAKLKQTVKENPLNVREVTDIKFIEAYDVEVKVEGHTFRRNKATGRWCRFSIEVCNIDVDEELDELVETIHDTRPKSGLEEVGVSPMPRGYAIEDIQLDYLKKSGWQGLENYYPRIDFYKGGTPAKVTKKGRTITEISNADVVSVKSTYVTDPTGLKQKIRHDLSRLNRNYYSNRTRDFILKKVKGKKLHLIFEQGFMDDVIENAGVLKVLDDMTTEATSLGITFEWFVIPVDGTVRNGRAFMKEIQDELAEL